MNKLAAIDAYLWPDQRFSVASQWQQHGLLLIQLRHDIDLDRNQARVAIRQAIRQAMIDCHMQVDDLKPFDVQLHSSPGTQPALNVRGQRYGVSIAHEAGVSITAISRSGYVGVDIVRTGQSFDWQTVAKLYLGPNVLATLLQTQELDRVAQFYRAWTQLEACCKALGKGLTEWSADAEPDANLKMDYFEVGSLPPEYFATLALK